MRAGSGAFARVGCLVGVALASGCDVVFGIEEGQLGSVAVTESITADTTWTKDTARRLKGLIFVGSGARLTIEPGTTVLADPGSALIVTRDGEIEACGTSDAPIVFTSSQRQRRPGDWGGLVLAGSAPVNSGNGESTAIEIPEARLTYGGSNAGSSSGSLCFVRVEFGGAELVEGEQVPPLGFYGVGSLTRVHHVQVHAAASDSVLVAGGTVNLRHVLATEAGDGDAFKWVEGWIGKAQFLAAVMSEGHQYEEGLDGEGIDEESTGELISDPRIYNVTLVGQNVPPGGDGDHGIALEDGTRGIISHALVTGFTTGGLDIDGAATIPNAENGTLLVTNSIFANASSERNFDPDLDDVPGFSEEDWALAADKANREADSDQLGLRSVEPYAPDLSLESNSIALDSGVAPAGDAFFDASATFIGACGATCPDFEGWTSFPRE